MLRMIYSTYRAHGLAGVLFAARRFILPFRARCMPLCKALVRSKTGIEVGGPSGVFRSKGLLPLYPEVGALDNCNFAHETIWEGAIKEGQSFNFSSDRTPGRQYIAEMTKMEKIPSDCYDFLLSSHVIEHTANPLKALSEWIRILKDGGILVILVPHKDGTFDHLRSVSQLKHLMDDFENDTSEDDLTHLSEILALHNLKRDPGAGTSDEFKIRSEHNVDNRCLHHHVFDTPLVVQMLDLLGLQLHVVEAARPNHIIAVAQKLPAGKLPDNGRFLTSNIEFLNLSPFASDRNYYFQLTERR